MSDAMLSGRPFVRRAIGLASQALVVGIVTSLVVIALDRTLFGHQVATAPPLWTGLLYALAGGISEEVLFHYGLLTALVSLARPWMPGATAYWVAIVASGLALGLSHLTWLVMPVTPVLPLASVVLTFIVGVVTGWLYWRRGLESAMLAHGLISLALHLAAPGL